MKIWKFMEDRKGKTFRFRNQSFSFFWRCALWDHRPHSPDIQIDLISLGV